MKTVVTSKMGRQVLKIQKNSPVILFAAGVVGVVGTAVLAGKATLRVESVLDEHSELIEKIETAKTAMSDLYSPEDAKKDTVKVFAKTTISLVKLYGPTFLVGAASIAALTGSHIILNRRYAGAVAAYGLLDASFKGYQERVKEKFGEDVALELQHGLVDREITEVTPDGAVTRVVKGPDGSIKSPYARYFDAASTQWQRWPSHNAIFLRAQQNWANDLLKARGHVWLNEVYQMLGFEHTKAGAMVGWVLGDEGDGMIDFGVFSGLNDHMSMSFVCGDENSILLDFNVDGIILDKI